MDEPNAIVHVHDVTGTTGEVMGQKFLCRCEHCGQKYTIYAALSEILGARQSARVEADGSRRWRAATPCFKCGQPSIAWLRLGEGGRKPGERMH